MLYDSDSAQEACEALHDDPDIEFLREQVSSLQSKLQASEARVKKLEEEKGYWKAQARHAIDKSEECFRVLHAIAYPIKAMQEEAEKDGAKLNGGAAISLAKDANYLTGLAKSAIENS
jgi:hypothetical protein